MASKTKRTNTAEEARHRRLHAEYDLLDAMEELYGERGMAAIAAQLQAVYCRDREARQSVIDFSDVVVNRLGVENYNRLMDEVGV